MCAAVRVRGAALCRRLPVGVARKAWALPSLQSQRLEGPWGVIMSSSGARERRREEGWRKESQDEALGTHITVCRCGNESTTTCEGE